MKNLILLSAFLVSNLLCSQSNSLPQSIPTDGLYGYWPLDGNINDLSGNANDGSTDGTFTTDAFENEDAAVYLNNQLIILPVNDQLNVENFTIQFWTKAVSYNIHNKVQIADPSGPWRWAINWADSVSPLYGGHFLYYTPGECDGSYADSGNNINNLVSIDRNVWHSLTVVVEGQQTSFYKDGNLITVSNESSNLTCFNDDMNIYFGGDVPGAIEYYNGWFDNIAIWTRALNSDEVELIYSSTQNGNQCSEVSINASSTNICTGESVDLSVDGLNSSSGINTQSHSFTTGNYTRIPYSPHLYNLPQSTIEFWYYQESSSEEFIVATEYFNTGWGFHVENNGGSPRFLEWRVSNGAARLGFDIPDRYEIPFNQWIHVAGVHDGSTVYLFVDGNLIDSAPYTGQIGDSYEDIVINRHTWASGSSERLNGKIDELRISNIARYTSNFTPPVYEFNNDSNTLALWHFNGNMQDESQYNTQSVTNGTNFSSNVPFGSYNFNSTDLLWSTGDTIPNITVTPTETTEYWVDVTTNGLTCREYVTINVTAPAAPTGDAEQTFCDAATVADLTATGDNIQWYDAVTGGNLLDPTSALTDGQMVYATQTVNGCESIDRLEVTVSIQDITITASATEVCAGESVDLTVSSGLTAGTTACTSAELPANLQTGLVGYWPFCGNANDESGNGNNGTVNGATLTTDRFGNANSAYSFDGGYIITSNNTFDNGWNEKTISIWVKPNNLTNYNQTIYITPGHNGESLSFNHANSPGGFSFWKNSDINVSSWDIFLANPLDYNFNNLSEWINIVITQQDLVFDFYINGSPDTELLANQNALQQLTGIMIGWSQSGSEYFNGDLDDLAIWNRALTPSEIQQLANSSTYTWSTGDTTETISVTPTETTEYWVDITANGITCREYFTINVTAPVAPTGPLTQAFCDIAAVADLTATGENIQWYDAASGGNLLDSTTVLTDGQMVYASQTVNGCESTERLEVTVSVQDITITASSTVVCTGETITITAQRLGLFFENKFCSKDEIPITLHDSLLGAWPFCGNPNDVSGNNFNGTTYGGVSLGESRFGDLNDSYIFDGQPLTYVSMGTHESLDITQGSISISCWVDVNNVGGTKTILSKANNDTSNLFGSYNLHINGDTNFVVTNSTNTNGFYSVTNGSPTYDGWLNIIAVADINDLKLRLYIDGLLVSEIDWEGTYKGGLQEFLIGSHYKSDFASQYMYNFSGSIDDVAIWNRVLNQYEVDYLSMTNSSTYTWSTGDTTENITVTPTETTEYWVDVTTNGVTCREYVTINVTNPTAPSGDAEQTFCDAATVADLTATGENIQWYDAASGGNLLDSATALTDGQMVYASQTVNGCESTDRLEVSVSIQEITITASATEVCAGESVDLSVEAAVSATNIVYENNFDNGPGEEWINGYTSTFTSHPEYGEIFGPFASGDQPQFNLLDVSNGEFNISFDLFIINSWDGDGTPNHPNGPDILNFNVNGVNIFNSTFSNHSIELGFGYDQPQSFPSNYGDGSYQAGNSGNLIASGFDWTIDYNCNANSYPMFNYNISEELVIDNQNINFELFKNFAEFDGNGLCAESWALDNLVITQINVNSSTYTWSTGDTTENITVTPTETTEYWVDVTTNGVTCREYVTINVTAPAAPTGDAEQTFCDAATVSDLSATGENIQWYDAATGGNLLDSTTALTDGQMVYASQTVNGCESTDRLEVTVSIQDITITASATELCAGESVDLSVIGGINSTYLWSTGESNFSGQGTLVDEYSLIANTVSQNTFSIIPGNIYRLEVSGTISLGGGAGNQRDVAYYIQSGSDGTIEGTPFDSACNLRIWTSLFCDTPGLRPSPDIYDASTHTYNYPFNANSSTLDVGFWDSPLSDNGPNVVTFKLYELSNSESTITVSPTETTEYWVDVTTNGVTCREYVTISVNDLPEAPTGESVNYFINCDSFSPTLDDAIATLTGENIKLYDAAVGGNLLDPNSNIIDGQVVYASQTLDSCESSDRLEVQLNLYTLEMPVTDAPDNTVSFCNEQNLTILDLAPAQTATDRLWYETATSTTPIAETTPLVDGVTYYVSNHDIETGCESDRLAMTVEINNPEAPTGDGVQSFCDNVTVSDLLATGSNIQWYDAATGGNLLDPSSALSDGQFLYASQTENSCESITRLEVSVEIDIIPDPILITTELEFCLAREATLTDLEVDDQGFALEWYDSFSGGNMLPMNTLLEDGVSYYATLYDAASSCESLMRLEVVPTVIPCEVVIYNAISLNDNGMNDYMVIENAEYFPDNSLEVYNRDGHLLYSQTQYGIGGNLFRGKANVSGIYNKNSNLPTGSYLYVFKYFNPYEQQQYTLKGFLTINSN